jgi:SulP family sulfate permease
LVLSGVHAQPMVAMTGYGLVEKIGVENMLANLDEALKRAREILSVAV